MMCVCLYTEANLIFHLTFPCCKEWHSVLSGAANVAPVEFQLLQHVLLTKCTEKREWHVMGG